MRDIEAGDVSSAQTTLGRERLSPGREPLSPWGLCLCVCTCVCTSWVGSGWAVPFVFSRIVQPLRRCLFGGETLQL